MSNYTTHTNLGDQVRSVMFPEANSITPHSALTVKTTTVNVVSALEKADIHVTKLGVNTWLVRRSDIPKVREVITRVAKVKKVEKTSK